MSEEERNNNDGAGATQPGVFGNNGTGAPAGGNPAAPAGGNSPAPAGDNPPAPAGGNPAAPAGGNPAAPAGGNPPAPAGGNPAAPAGDNPPAPAGGESVALPELADYATTLFDGVDPESLDYQLFERARVAAHKAGVPADALSAVMGDVRTFINETERQIEEARLDASKEQLKQLQQTYGSKFKAVMEACNNTLSNLATQYGVDASVFNLPEICNNPEVVKFFYGLSQQMKEAGFANVNQMASIATAEQELDSIYSGTHELSNAYYDSTDPNWKRAQDRVNELTRMTMGN